MKKIIYPFILTNLLLALPFGFAFAGGANPLPAINNLPKLLPSACNGAPVACINQAYNNLNSLNTALNQYLPSDSGVGDANSGLVSYLQKNYFTQVDTKNLFKEVSNSPLATKAAGANVSAGLSAYLGLPKSTDLIANYLNNKNPFASGSNATAHAATSVNQYFQTNFAQLKFIQSYLDNEATFTSSNLQQNIAKGLSDYFKTTPAPGTDFIATYLDHNNPFASGQAQKNLLTDINSGLTSGSTVQKTIQSNLAENLGDTSGNLSDALTNFSNNAVSAYLNNPKNNPFSVSKGQYSYALDNVVSGLNSYLQNLSSTPNATDFIGNYLNNANVDPFAATAKTGTEANVTKNIDNALGNQVEKGQSLTGIVSGLQNQESHIEMYCAVVSGAVVNGRTPMQQLTAALKGSCAKGGVLKLMPGNFEKLTFAWLAFPSNLIVEGSGQGITHLTIDADSSTSNLVAISNGDTFSDLSIDVNDTDGTKSLAGSLMLVQNTAAKGDVNFSNVDFNMPSGVGFQYATIWNLSGATASFNFDSVTSTGAGAFIGSSASGSQRNANAMGPVTIENSAILNKTFYQVCGSSCVTDVPTDKTMQTGTPLPVGSKVINSSLPSDAPLVGLDATQQYQGKPVTLAFRVKGDEVFNSCFMQLARTSAQVTKNEASSAGPRYANASENQKNYSFPLMSAGEDFDRLCPSDASTDDTGNSLGGNSPADPGY